nr:homoserine kinase-like [Ipomoea batatas]
MSGGDENRRRQSLQKRVQCVQDPAVLLLRRVRLAVSIDVFSSGVSTRSSSPTALTLSLITAALPLVLLPKLKFLIRKRMEIGKRMVEAFIQEGNLKALAMVEALSAVLPDHDAA